MDDFLLVHNIAQSSFTFLHNNLSLQIYDTFITSGQGMPTSRDSNRLTIWAIVIYIQEIINGYGNLTIYKMFI